MTIYDFFQEQIVPFFKTDYQDFDSKKVNGYEVFKAKWDKKEREAMVTADALELLRRIQEKFVTSPKYKEEELGKSQIGRWYVNGFTMAYNYCRRYDLDHPHRQTDFTEFAKKLKSSEDLEQGVWDVDKFRKYTINLGRHEGTLFYMAENPITTKIDEEMPTPIVVQNEVHLTPQINVTAPQPSVVINNEVHNEKAIEPVDEEPKRTEEGLNNQEYNFPEGILEDLYEQYNDEVFKRISSLEEFRNILTRAAHQERLSECKGCKLLVYNILYNLDLLLPDSTRKCWLDDIAAESGYNVDTIEKKHTGNDLSSKATEAKMKEINELFEDYR